MADTHFDKECEDVRVGEKVGTDTRQQRYSRSRLGRRRNLGLCRNIGSGSILRRTSLSRSICMRRCPPRGSHSRYLCPNFANRGESVVRRRWNGGSHAPDTTGEEP